MPLDTIIAHETSIRTSGFFGLILNSLILYLRARGVNSYTHTHLTLTTAEGGAAAPFHRAASLSKVASADGNQDSHTPTGPGPASAGGVPG